MADLDATVTRPDDTLTRIGRRLITIPLYLGLLCVLTPMLLPVSVILGIVDVLRRKPLPLPRTVVFLWYYLLCETVGILVSGLMWIAALLIGEPRSPAGPRFLTWNYELQRQWGAALGRGAFAIFGIKLDAEPVPPAADGSDRPILLFIRHASVADTLLAVMLITGSERTRLRYVLKRELLWDPCLDIVGNRIPNYFVSRDSTDSSAESAAVGRLMTGLGGGEGVLIYPEGTRFTPSKQRRIRARLDEGDDRLAAERARQLERVLPPRPGGYLELLRGNGPEIGADVLFCVHSGLEKSTSFNELTNGGLIGSHVSVRFWRVPFSELPTDDQARVDWMHEQWKRVDSVVREIE